ncbi:hypothetical protein HELRODRAFT_151351, partial [Helobdella robusta]|uniref:SAM domain-containing protein n=1 Tax=Helobdella robusta TaxID=6412 RepID=T1EKJ7_HELRO
QNDKLGFEAISILHSYIDANKDGGVEQSESQEFLQEDLQRADQSVSQPGYHSNDNHVTVHDLWDYWVQSEVYNWTVDEVVDWLDVHVDLHQYSQLFKLHDVNGKLLPRLASTIHNPLYTMLGIRNIIHKQKIALKAADIVLFG